MTASLESISLLLETVLTRLDALQAHALFELTGRISENPKMVQFLASSLSPLAFAGLGTIVEFWHAGRCRYDLEFTTFIYVYEPTSESINEHPLMTSLEAAAEKDLVIPSNRSRSGFLADSYATAKFPNVLQMAEVGYERGGFQLAFKTGTSMAEAVKTAIAVFREFYNQRIPRACKLFQLRGGCVFLERHLMNERHDKFDQSSFIDRKSRSYLPEVALGRIDEWEI